MKGNIGNDYVESYRRQLAEWQSIYIQNKDSLTANRLSGHQLDEYFRSRYAPSDYNNDKFRDIVYQSAKDTSDETAITDIVTYCVDGKVLVGIDLRSGYFHVESENIEDSVPVWDDLFVKRGLNEEDMKNYVLVAQYVILKGENR